MRKREKGYSPATDDWEYSVLNGDGTSVLAQGQLKKCETCHTDYKSTDYVARTYLSNDLMRRLKQITITRIILDKLEEKRHCCESMTYQVNSRCAMHPDPFDCADSLVYYSEKSDSYGIIIHDGGYAVISIRYCPWCGVKIKHRVKRKKQMKRGKFRARRRLSE